MNRVVRSDVRRRDYKVTFKRKKGSSCSIPSYQGKDDNEEAKCVESAYFSFPLLLSNILLFTKYLWQLFFKFPFVSYFEKK